MQLLHVIRVLVIADSQAERYLIASTLQSTAFRFVIEFAHDDRQAVRYLQAIHYDMVLIDLQISVATCVEILTMAYADGRNTFVVAISDTRDIKSEALFKAFGAYDVLKKPFTEYDLRRLIETYFIIKLKHEMLLVDQSTAVRGIIRKILARSIFNLAITEAATAEQALAATAARTFRIIFSDLHVPDMSGIELTRMLADRDPTSSIVLMTTEISPALDAVARDAGAMACLQKPFSDLDVDVALHHVFGLPRAQFSKAVTLFASA